MVSFSQVSVKHRAAEFEKSLFVHTVCTYAPPYHQRCWLLNWTLMTRWKVSLLFSPEDTVSLVIVFTDSGFWKYSWAHLVMSMTESCQWVMQCRLRARRSQHSNKGLWSCPFSFSESFDDVMHCRWWDLQSLCNLTLRNVVFKVFHNLFTHSFTDWRASAHLYFWETLPL